MGLPLIENNFLYTLCFADDQVLIAQGYEDIKYKTRKLMEQCAKWELEVNLNNTI